MKVLVIHNLGSGYGEGAIYDFIRTYSVDGDSVTMRFFNGITPFSELLKDAKDFDFVVACGGDKPQQRQFFWQGLLNGQPL